MNWANKDKMKRLLAIILIFLYTNIAAQDYKDQISVVQFSAPFTQSSEISLKKFSDHNTHTFHITEKGDVFKKENITYLPTIILFHNGKEVVRIESGISLKLPDDTIDIINDNIEEILANKF